MSDHLEGRIPTEAGKQGRGEAGRVREGGEGLGGTRTMEKRGRDRIRTSLPL